MKIRKLFKFENAHVVRNCSSDRCKFSIHGHSYKVEVILQGDGHNLDNGQMLYDFGLMKGTIKDFIDSFDHAITLWADDSDSYVTDMIAHSARWISLPVSPSAEQFARFFYLLVERVLENTDTNNGEAAIGVHSVIVHETDTGYAEAELGDVYSGFEEGEMIPFMDLSEVVFSDQVMIEWSDPDMFDKLLNKVPFVNPVVKQQVVK